MQAYANTLRDQVWKSLENIFLKQTGGKGTINSTGIEEIVRNVLGEKDQNEVDYVIKNLFRLDTDGSGSIDFLEFANFLLKRHCGQISLQRRHRAKKMKLGAERKMDCQQFIELLNDAYSFLQVVVDPVQTAVIFKETDKDADGYITYVEYFQFIEKYLLKPLKPVEQPKPVVQTKDYNSRLRGLFWWFLRRLYDFYDKDHNHLLDPREIETLIREVLHQTTQKEIEFVLQSIFNMDTAGHKGISFEVFVVSFLKYLADLGLSRWSTNHPNGDRRLTVEDFIILFRNSFSCIGAARVTDAFLRLWFLIIDKKKLGYITFTDYLRWVQIFLCTLKYNFVEYYFIEDDEAFPNGTTMILPADIETPKPVDKPAPVSIIHTYTFSNWDLAKRARSRILHLLFEWDKDKNGSFEEKEIIQFLIDLLKSDDFDIFYVIANVFRYDTNNDKRVTYVELADFFLEAHNGEMSIQRRHKRGYYSKGAERIMNLVEFKATLVEALAYIQVEATDDELNHLFSEIDFNKNGWITYEVYFEFLRHYFGTLSKVRPDDHQFEIKPCPPVDPYAGLSPEERFARITIEHVLLFFPNYKLQPFNRNEIARLLRELFLLNDSEIDYILNNFFRFDTLNNGYILESEMAKIFLELLFAEIILLRQHRLRAIAKWQERLISLSEFLVLVQLSTRWMKVPHDKALLEEIFIRLDTNKDGYISYKEYIAFIRKYLGGHANWNDDDWFKTLDPAPPVPDPTGDEEGFYGYIWSELRELYKHYVKGQFLTEQELELLIVEVLKESNKRDLEYVFWNLFRVDPNSDRKIEFEQFAPFILKHAGEIALRNFHVDQTLGKSTLTEAEFKLVVRKAYAFLRTINKSDVVLHAIFQRLSKGGNTVTYGNYVGWVFRCIANKVR